MAQAKTIPGADGLSSAPTAPAKKKSCWKIGLIILGVVVVLVIIIIVIAMWATSGLLTPIEGQLKALKAGDINTAYSYTSNQFQQATSLEQFTTFVNQYPSLKSNKDYSFTNRTNENGIGTVDGKLTAADGTVVPVEYKLVKENNEWKILGIDINPTGGTNNTSSSPTPQTNQTNQTGSQTNPTTPTISVNKINGILVSDVLDSRGVVVTNKDVISKNTKEINATVYINVTKPAQLGAALVKADTNEVVATVKRDMTTTGDMIYNFIFPLKTAAWTPGQYLIYSETSTGDTGQVVFTIQ